VYSISVAGMQGRGKNQVQLPGARKLSSWASGTGSLVVKWTSEIFLNRFVN